MYTSNQADQVKNIKSEIVTLENSLEKFMDMDVSSKSVRIEIRNVTNKIGTKNDELSAYLSDIRV